MGRQKTRKEEKKKRWMKLSLVIRASVPAKRNGMILSPVNQVLNESNVINVDPHRLMVRNCCQTNMVHTFFMKLEVWLIKVIIFALASVRHLF